MQLNVHLEFALRRAVVKGLLVQVAGPGASGRFKLPAKKTSSAAKTAKKEAPKKKTELKPKPGTENVNIECLKRPPRAN